MARRRGRSSATSSFPGFVDVTQIGGGAFSTVYRAVEEATDRPVALKALRVESLPPFIVEAFDQEMKALGAVSSHPNIVTFLRPLKTREHQAVLVLELCEESYAQRIRRTGPITAREAVSVGIKIAGALETAHRAGFLHRDVKPQNLLVTRYGEPALSDFGVAALRSSAQATEGVFGFTTLHASPEILEGRPLSPATDVYGLASSLYQLLSGAAPFAAFEGEAPAAVILRILSQPVAPLRDEAVPFELSHLLEEALAKDPDSRPHSALILADRFRAVEAACGWPPTTPVIWQPAEQTAGPGRVAVGGDPERPPAGDAAPLLPTSGRKVEDRDAASERVLIGLPGTFGAVPAPASADPPSAPTGRAVDPGGTRTGLVVPDPAPRRVVDPVKAGPPERIDPVPTTARPATSRRTPKMVPPPPPPPYFGPSPDDHAPTPTPPPPPPMPWPRFIDSPAADRPADLPAPKVAPIYTTDRDTAHAGNEFESTVLPRLHPAAITFEKAEPVTGRRRLFRRRNHREK